MSSPKTFEDGDMEFDDKGYRVYWDAVEEGWVASKKFATKRFFDLLDSRPDFEGFDDGADEYDSDEEDDYLCSPSEPECPPEPDTPPPEVETPANLECCEMCGAPCLEEERREWTDYNGTEILYCDGCYDRMMERKQAKQQCECCDNEATESFDGIPSCKSCYDNGIEYLKSQGADI